MREMLIRSSGQLEAFGRKFGRKVLKSSVGHSARIIALSGELGAGKTTFLHGFAKGLGIKARITSPTFILARRHRIPKTRNKKQDTRYKYFWHLDVYRLRNEKDLDSIDFKEIISDPCNIVAVEWADRIKKAIPYSALWIQLSHHKRGRRVTLPVKLYASRKR